MTLQGEERIKDLANAPQRPSTYEDIFPIVFKPPEYPAPHCSAHKLRTPVVHRSYRRLDPCHFWLALPTFSSAAGGVEGQDTDAL